MRVFVTGASGFVGSAVVAELLRAGHQVSGLARSSESAVALTAAGATPHLGSLEDLDSLRAGAAAADGVIHCAFIHDFSNFQHSATVDRQAIETLGEALAGSDRPFVITSGTAALPPGQVSTERDVGDPAGHAGPRLRNEQKALAFAGRGVRSAAIRLPPSVHGEGDHGFVPALINIARSMGVAGYVGDGSNRWPAVHRLDAARLYQLAVESAPAGSILHGVGDEGIPTRDIAEVIGRHLGLPVVSIAPENAADHFGFLGGFFSLDVPASSALTRELLGWQPTQPGLLEDLDANHYFRPTSA
jgi:nucleoside-diphosphate-sugar epimerase